MFLVCSKSSKGSYLSKGKFKCLTVPYTNWHLIASLTFSYHSTTHSFGSTLAFLLFRHCRHATALGSLPLCILWRKRVLFLQRDSYLIPSSPSNLCSNITCLITLTKIAPSCPETPYFPLSCNNFHPLHTIYVHTYFVYCPPRMRAIVLFNTIYPMPRGVPATY